MSDWQCFPVSQKYSLHNIYGWQDKKNKENQNLLFLLWWNMQRLLCLQTFVSTFSFPQIKEKPVP